MLFWQNSLRELLKSSSSLVKEKSIVISTQRRFDLRTSCFSYLHMAKFLYNENYSSEIQRCIGMEAAQ
jgi:hypothetical protein